MKTNSFTLKNDKVIEGIQTKQGTENRYISLNYIDIGGRKIPVNIQESRKNPPFRIENKVFSMNVYEYHNTFYMVENKYDTSLYLLVDESYSIDEESKLYIRNIYPNQKSGCQAGSVRIVEISNKKDIIVFNENTGNSFKIYNQNNIEFIIIET